MGIDYYKVLGISKEATDLEVKHAYKDLSIVNNPRYVKSTLQQPQVDFSSQENKEAVIISEIKSLEALQMYHLLGEAYDVLSDPLSRQIFDNFGERGLKEGLPGPNGFIPPYAYHGDPDRTFREFFGNENPYTEMVNMSCGPFEDNFNFSGKAFRPRQPPIYRDLWVTLEELYAGCVKKVMISKKVLLKDGLNTEIETKVLTIPIAPGTLTGQEFNFPNEGDQGVQFQPADVTFVIRELKHEFFTREGINLIQTANITLTEALTGTSVPIRALNKRSFKVSVVHIVEPGYEKIVKGEGFPIVDEPGRRGDLIIRFNVKFPNVVTQSQKAILRSVLVVNSVDGQKSCYERPTPISLKLNKDIVCLGETTNANEDD